MKLVEINSNSSQVRALVCAWCVLVRCPLIRPVPLKPIYLLRPLGHWLHSRCTPWQITPPLVLPSPLLRQRLPFLPEPEVLTLSSASQFLMQLWILISLAGHFRNTQTFDLSSRKGYLGTLMFDERALSFDCLGPLNLPRDAFSCYEGYDGRRCCLLSYAAFYLVAIMAASAAHNPVNHQSGQ